MAKETLVVGVSAGYDPEVGAALWRLEDARDRTLRVLKEVPAEAVDAESGGNSIGTILYHLALIEADWLFSEILEREIPSELAALLPADDRDHAGILTTVRGQTMEEHLSRLATVRKALLQEMRAVSDEDFHRPRRLPSYDVSPAWVLHHLPQHEAEHRGEIGSILAALSG